MSAFCNFTNTCISPRRLRRCLNVRRSNVAIPSPCKLQEASVTTSAMLHAYEPAVLASRKQTTRYYTALWNVIFIILQLKDEFAYIIPNCKSLMTEFSQLKAKILHLARNCRAAASLLTPDNDSDEGINLSSIIFTTVNQISFSFDLWQNC